MSERSVNENNKLWEAAEKIAEAAVRNAKTDNEAERRKLKKRVIKLVLLMMLIALIIVFASIAWFAMNKAVTADTMAIEAAGSGFDLATSEPKVSYEDVLGLADDEYERGNAVTLEDKNGGEGTYYMLSGAQKLILQCHPNAKDITTGNKDVQPGDWDKLNLYIVPSQDGTVKAKINIEVIPYAEIEKKDANGDPIYKLDEHGDPVIVDGNPVPDTELVKVTTLQEFTAAVGPQGANNSKAVQEAENYIAAANYLKGHIMFFGGEGDMTNDNKDSRYYFTTPYTDLEVDFQETDASRNTAYEVPLYWMWPNTLGQIALRDNTSKLRKGEPVVSDGNDDEKDEVVQYLVDNKSSIFANSSDITETIINSADEPANFKLLSDGYNKADFSIGSYISYFMIELSVSGQ